MGQQVPQGQCVRSYPGLGVTSSQVKRVGAMGHYIFMRICNAALMGKVMNM